MGIEMYDNFDQLQLATRIEKHEIMELRRIATLIYKKSLRWRQSMKLSVDDKLYKDAMETAAQSGEAELAEELLKGFIEDGNKECFAACLYTCYDLIKPDVALQLAWMNGMTDHVMPNMIQVMRNQRRTRPRTSSRTCTLRCCRQRSHRPCSTSSSRPGTTAGTTDRDTSKNKKTNNHFINKEPF